MSKTIHIWQPEVKAGRFQPKTIRIVLSVQKVGKKKMVQWSQRPFLETRHDKTLKPCGDDSAGYKILAFTGLHKDRVLGVFFLTPKTKIGMEAFSLVMFICLLVGYLAKMLLMNSIC